MLASMKQPCRLASWSLILSIFLASCGGQTTPPTNGGALVGVCTSVVGIALQAGSGCSPSVSESSRPSPQAPAVPTMTPAPGLIWVASWADAPTSTAGSASSEQTFREMLKPTVGSRGTVRLHFSNYFGSSSVTLGAVHIGQQSSGAAVNNDTSITFSGHNSVQIPPGGFVTSDSVTFSFSYGAILAVTEYVTGSWLSLTQHTQGVDIVTNYATARNAGNKTSDTAGTNFTQTTYETYLLDRLDVYGNYKATVAAFGSSTTDGYNSNLNAHMTYPEQLAAALHVQGRDDVAIANEGIAGNQLLEAVTGVAGISRFSRDVLALPNVSSVIDYLGANDLRSACVKASSVITGMDNLISQAHGAGIKFYLATTAPSTFCGSQNPHGFGTRYQQSTGEEAERFALNAWDVSKQSSEVDGKAEQPPNVDAIIDFSGALSDPSNLSYMLPAYDSGDDVHPNDMGYGVMAKAIPLTLF